MSSITYKACLRRIYVYNVIYQRGTIPDYIQISMRTISIASVVNTSQRRILSAGFVRVPAGERSATIPL